MLGSPVPVIAQLCPPQSLRVGDKPLCPSREGASRTHATRHSPSPPLALDICAKRCIADDADKIMLASSTAAVVAPKARADTGVREASTRELYREGARAEQREQAGE